MFKWLKKKKGVEVIDLVDLQKRGLLKPKPKFKPDNGIVDLTKPQPPASPATSEDSSALSFLGAMATSAEATTNSSMSQENYSGISSSQLDNLKEQVNSLSYKLSRILDRLEVVEKKMDRHERGSSV